MATVELPLVEADNRGIRALRDESSDTVLIWYEEIAASLGLDPENLHGPVIEMPEPWDTTPPLRELIQELASKRSGGRDVTQWLYEQQHLLWYQEKERSDADAGAAQADGSRLAVEASRGGGPVSGRSEDGVQVGAGEPAAKQGDSRRPSKVQGKARAGKTGR